MPLVELSWNLKWLKWTWNERSPWKNIVHYWFEYEMDQSKVCQHLMQNRAQSLVLNPPSKGFLHDRLVTFNRFIDDTLHSSSPLAENNDRTLKHKNIPFPMPPKTSPKKHFHLVFLPPSVSKHHPPKPGKHGKRPQTFFPYPNCIQYSTLKPINIPSPQTQKKTPASHVSSFTWRPNL